MELPDSLLNMLPAEQEMNETPQSDKPKKLPLLHIERNRRGNKIATLVLGHNGTDEEISILAKSLRQTLAVGGSVRDGEILLQGDIVDKTKETLQKWGYRVK